MIESKFEFILYVTIESKFEFILYVTIESKFEFVFFGGKWISHNG